MGSVRASWKHWPFPSHLEMAKQQLRGDRCPKESSQETEKLGLKLYHLMSGDSQAGALRTDTGGKTGHIPPMDSNVLAIGGEILA